MNTIILPGASPSLNALMRWHWAKRKRELSRLILDITVHAAREGWRFATGHESYTITRRSNGTLDHDNLVGGLKLYIDALVKCGFAVDDDIMAITITYRQERGNPAVLIERTT